MFEKKCFHETVKYLSENKSLFNSQFGLRELHSTEQLIPLELVDQYVDCGKISLSVFLDMPDAFNTLNHNILTN